MKVRELPENFLNDMERFSSEEEYQRAIAALSKDLDAVKQSILDDSKIVKKAISSIFVKTQKWLRKNLRKKYWLPRNVILYSFLIGAEWI